MCITCAVFVICSVGIYKAMQSCGMRLLQAASCCTVAYHKAALYFHIHRLCELLDVWLTVLV